MTRLIVSERDGSEIANQDANAYDLPESRGTDVRLGISRDDIESMVRQGDDLIIRLENGEIVTLEDYFVATADELPHRLFTEEAAGFLPLGLTEAGGAAAATAAAAAGATGPGLGLLGGLGAIALIAAGGSGGSAAATDDNITLQDDIDDVDGDGDIDDELIGTENDDELNGFGGNDTIIGLEGDDVLIGGSGDDSIEGGENDDDISGNDGNDTLLGNEGEDVISGGDDNDLIEGGASNDTLSGDAGNDTILGNGGADDISGGTGDDSVDGGDGNDDITGDAGMDMLNGNDGADTISGGDDDDVIDGGFDNDVLSGDDGNDAITGDNGDDVIDGGDGNDTLAGNNGEDTINGGEGNDLIEGGASNDTLSGDAGNDTLFGSNGADTINGGAGDDSANGGESGDLINGDAGMDTLNGNEGEDTINGGADDDVINGGADDDIISGGTGDDELMGEGGSDTFIVEDNAGNDTIIGGESADDFDVIDLTNVTEPFEVVFDEDDSEAGTITIGDDVIQFEEIEAVLTNAAPVIDPTDGTIITGTGDAGSTVTLTDTDGNLIGNALVSNDGTWTVVPEDTVEEGTILEATQAPEDGDDSPLSNQVTPNDTDGDLVSDSIDIDDDGDGITDLTEEGLFIEDFGNGETTDFAGLDSQVSTDLGYDADGYVNDNNYAIKVNEELGAWSQAGDNSDDADGRFLVVNAGTTVGDVYARNLDVDPDAPLQIQFDARNLLNASNAARDDRSPPNLSFEVRDLDGVVLGSFDAGDIPGDESWHTYAFEIDPQGNDTVELAIVSNRADNLGNDVGIDNIIVNQAGADQDGNGVANSLDLDSDGDGASDIHEAQNGETFIAPSNVDADGNGLDDAFESAPGAGEGLSPADTNEDARPDYLDDADGGAVVLDFGRIEAQAPSEMDSTEMTDNADEVLDALAVEMAAMNASPQTLDLGDGDDASAATPSPAVSSGGTGVAELAPMPMIPAFEADIETII